MCKPKRLFKILIIITLFVFFSMWIISSIFLPVPDTLTLSYANNASARLACAYSNFYVYDNTLYFYDDVFRDTIKYVKNNVIHTFAKLSFSPERLYIVDDKTAIIQPYGGRPVIYAIKKGDNTPTKLWDGECVGCYDNTIFFIRDNTLYSAKIGQTVPDTITIFSGFLACDYAGVTYRVGENVYQTDFAQPQKQKLLISGGFPWCDLEDYFLIGAQLFTPNYALHLSPKGLEMYVYETKEIKELYKVDENCVSFTVVAKENELYVSREYMDQFLWPVLDYKNNKKINGTYKYDITEGSWTKISNRTFNTLAQFDDNYLYGYNVDTLFPRIVRFKTKK